MKRLAFLCFLAAVAAACSAQQAIPAAAAPTTTTVDGDVTVHEGGTLEVDEFVVASGQRLVLRGVDVRVGTSILVESGASLRLEPLGTTPTRVQPINDTAGFWILVEGHIESAGLPATEISGVSGDVLETVRYYMPGAFQINGTAVLRDLYFHNSTAGFLVAPDGHLVLERSQLVWLEFMGIAALGKVEVANTSFRDTSIAISGRTTCDVTVHDSTFASWGGHFQMNRCPLRARNVVGEGGSTGMVFLGRGPYDLENVHVRGYQATGLRGDGSAVIRVANSTFEGGPHARNGIALKPDHELTLVNVSVTGGTRHAVEVQSSQVRIEGGRFVGSEGYGIQFVDTPWEMPLDATQRMDFGLGTPAANKMGAVDVRRIVHVVALNEEDLPVRGLQLEIVDRSTGEVVYETNGSSETGAAMVILPVFREEEGRLVARGPFDYVARHPAAQTERGTLEDDQDLLQVQLHSRDGEGLPPGVLATIVLGGLGVLLLLYALFEGSIKRRLRGRSGGGGA